MNVDPTSMSLLVEPEPGGSSAPTRILVTEEKDEARRAVVRALGDKYQCDFAGDVGEVREKLETGRFELALCGVTMPGAPGLALAEEIGRDHPDTAVVLVTGEDDPEVAREAIAFGVYGYLVEPFWPGQLLITIMNALRRRELELAARTLRQNLAEQSQKIIDMAPMPIYVKDASYRYVLANLRADALAGLEDGELVGLGDEAIMSPQALERTRAIDREMFEQGTVYDVEETLVMGGVERDYKTVRFPLLGEGGKVTAVCGMSVDITDQKEAIRLRDQLATAQQQAIEELWASHRETVDRFAKAIKLHDASTGDHVGRMASVASLLGSKLKLDGERVRLLRLAAPMHDVGKIAITDQILRKPGPLTPAERTEMQRHTVIGHDILGGSESELLRVAATISLTHHERFDGNGYPYGLAGDDIPIEGRITAVADVFDALLSDRCYRPAFPPRDAVAMIEAGRGSQFDPAIVDILLDHLDDALYARA